MSGNAWWKGAGVAAVLAGGGCHCAEDYRLMLAAIESAFAAELRCCHSLGEFDPARAVACIDELRARHRERIDLLFRWLEACRASERRLMIEIARSIPGLLLVGSCEGGPVRFRPDGRVATVGLPFGPDDTLGWTLHLPAEALADGSADGAEHGGKFAGVPLSLRIAGRTLDLVASGRIVWDGPDTVRTFEWRWHLPDDPEGEPLATLRYAPEEAEGRPGAVPQQRRGGGGNGRLGLLMRCELADFAPPVVPDLLWLEWPVARRGGGLTLGGPAMRLVELVPPDPGFADWNGDGTVDAADPAHFAASPDWQRDLDLDGVADAKDEAIFLRAWKAAIARP